MIFYTCKQIEIINKIWNNNYYIILPYTNF